MRNKLNIIFLIITGIFCLTATAFGQSETGQISGTVVDANNAAVAGATVTAVSTRTGFSRTTTTNQDGYYSISNVQPSTYDITITSGNFREFKVTREVSVASDVQINATLSAAGVDATVDIVAGGSDIAEVNTTDQTVSEVVSNKQLENLPTITRDPYQFINTVGNVSAGDNTAVGVRGLGVAINGQRSASTSILINGGENVDLYTAQQGQSIPLDSVQEFRVTTGTFTADTGRASGGVVNLITKSGQNDFFGSAYIFNRNSRFASAGFAANAAITAADRANGVQARQFFNRNQFGGSLGGPIFKNKLLFFTNTELTRIRSNASLTALVPSAASIAASAPATRNFFANYPLNATRTGATQSITSTSGRVLTFDEVRYSVPANTGAGIPQDGVQSANRIDWNVNERLQIYGTYLLEKSTQFEGSFTDSPYQGFNTGITLDNQNIQVAGTYSLTNNFVGTTRYTFNQVRNEQPLGEQPPGPSLYLRATAISLGGVFIAFPGYLPFNPGTAIPAGGPQKVHNISQEFNYNFGNHLFKFGGQYYKIFDNRVFGAYQNAVETLSTNSNAAAAENFFNGVIQQFQAAVDPQGRFPGQTLTLPVTFPVFGRNNRYDEFAVYGQDTFRLFPGFTANLGLRYEYYGPQKNADPTLDSNFYFGGNGEFSPANVRTGSVQIAPNSPVGNLWKADKNNFAPSVGFAYDIEGNGKSSLRAGYALRYERNFGNVTFNVIQNPPNYGVISVTSADLGGAAIPITLNNAGPLTGSGGNVTLPVVSLRAVDPNIVNAYAHQYSAAFERRFGSLTASATFSGTTGKKLYSIANINRRGSGLAYLGSNASGCAGLAVSDRLNCQYGDINFRGNGGYSSYQGITFAVESGNLFDTGLTMASRYTYSVARDNLSTTFSETGNAFNLGFLDAYNPSVDYGFADFDVRHRFVTNFVWDVPTRRVFNEGIGKAIFGDITLAGFVNIQSGSPFSVYDCANGFSTCTRLIPTGPISFNGKLGADTGSANNNVFIDLSNQSSVSLPGSPINIFPGENGFLPDNMTARNAFRGPGFWNVDLALTKRFFFSEKTNLQLRIDAQNVFNNANAFVNTGETDIFSSSTVTVSRAGRRQLQFGVRLAF